MRDWDVDPGDINPETGRPYAGYSSPSLDTAFHHGEMAIDDDDDPVPCTAAIGHEWYLDEATDRCLCLWCGADGDA